jgi:hypothetical protein
MHYWEGSGVMSARSLIVGFVAALASVAAGIVFTAPVALASEGCENEARRVEQNSTYLADCRAYEMVSPLNAQPSSLEGHYGPSYSTGRMKETVAAIDGERFIYSSWFNPPESTTLSHSYLDTRGSNGWTTESPTPPESTQAAAILCSPWPVGFSSNLSTLVVAGTYTAGCGHPEPPIAPDEREGAQNIYLRDSAGGFSLINPPPLAASFFSQGGGAYGAEYEDASADGSHVLFNEWPPLTPEAPPEGAATAAGNLYEWAGGAVHLVTFLPNGTPIGGSLANGGIYSGSDEESFPGAATITNAVSSNGERVVFYAGGNKFLEGSSLYLRLNAANAQSHINHVGECSEPVAACTVQVDESETTEPSVGARFRWATPTGSRIFFTDEGRLTTDSTAVAGKPDLYEYDLEKPKGERLTDMTVDVSEPADVLGVSGASEDGSYLYFVADGALTAVTEENANHEHAEAGKPNLYVRHAGIDTFIATLSAAGSAEVHSAFGSNTDADFENWTAVTQPGPGENLDIFGLFSARVSANGRFLAFNSERSLTGYDNLPAGGSEVCKRFTGAGEGAEPCSEIYLYDAITSELRCASCDQNGAPPVGPAQIFKEEERIGGGASPLNLGYYQRNLSNDGRVFFNSFDRLVPGDINGLLNVYEYFEGQQHLISSGTSDAPSMFADASADGRNVFFITAQGLVRGDTDGQESVYDARAGGGFALQNEAVVPPSCESVEGCRSPLSEPPAQLLSGSAALVGPGNLAAAPEQPGPKRPAVKKPAKCKKGFVRRNDKCVKTRHVKQKGKQRKRTAKGSRRAKHATYTHGSAK